MFAIKEKEHFQLIFSLQKKIKTVPHELKFDSIWAKKFGIFGISFTVIWHTLVLEFNVESFFWGVGEEWT